MPHSRLFPEFDSHPTRHAQRSYVMRRLVEMAGDGTLFVTDALNEREPIRTLVGECILGHSIAADGNQRTNEDVPQELLEYRVRIVSIPHMVQVDQDTPNGGTQSQMVEKSDVPIRFAHGTRLVDDGITYEAAKRTQSAFALVEQREKRWIETNATDVRLPLQQAYSCLIQQGENVLKAAARRLQRKLWKVREVRPGEESDAPRRGPGRPRKGDAAEAQP